MNRMPLGLRSNDRINVGDSAELRVLLFDNEEAPIPAEEVEQVQFTIQRPDKAQPTAAGDVLEDGSAFYRYLDTDEVGVYKYIATFTLSSGQIRSVRDSFEVIDPFNPPTPTAQEVLANEVWHKLEDTFDSEEGGPWLRDMTLSYFDKSKIPMFIPEALMLINIAPPTTNITIEHFTTPGPNGALDPDLPLLAHAVFLEVVRHLMRSYVEQPNPTGAQVVFEDRRDYLQRWQLIYQMELEHFERLLALWKRQFIGLGHGKILVTAKAGRLLPAPLRSRNIGRGYY